MSWDIKRDGERWGKRKLVKEKWLEGGIKVYEVELVERDEAAMEEVVSKLVHFAFIK